MLPAINNAAQSPQQTQLTTTGRVLRNTSWTLGSVSSAAFLALAATPALAAPGVNVITSATLFALLTPLTAAGVSTGLAAVTAAVSSRVFGQRTIAYSPVPASGPSESADERFVRIRQELSTVAMTLLMKYSPSRSIPKFIPFEKLLKDLKTLRSSHLQYKETKSVWYQAHMDFRRQGAIIVNGEVCFFPTTLVEDDRVDAILSLLKFACEGNAAMANNLALFCTQGYMEPILDVSMQENKSVQGIGCSPSIFMVTTEADTIQVSHALALSVSHLDDIEYKLGPGVPVWGMINYTLSKAELRSGDIRTVSEKVVYLIRTVMYPNDIAPADNQKPSYETTAADLDADIKKDFNLPRESVRGPNSV